MAIIASVASALVVKMAGKVTGIVASIWLRSEYRLDGSVSTVLLSVPSNVSRMAGKVTGIVASIWLRSEYRLDGSVSTVLLSVPSNVSRIV